MDNNDIEMDNLDETPTELNIVSTTSDEKIPEHSISVNVTEEIDHLDEISTELNIESTTSEVEIPEHSISVNVIEENVSSELETTTDKTVTESASEVLNEDNSENKSKQSTRLPLSRVKQIMKFDPDCSLISRDALLLVSKATELFIECLGKESVKHTQYNKKKTISKKDVEAAIECVPNLCFLDGALEWE